MISIRRLKQFVEQEFPDPAKKRAVFEACRYAWAHGHAEGLRDEGTHRATYNYTPNPFGPNPTRLEDDDDAV